MFPLIFIIFIISAFIASFMKLDFLHWLKRTFQIAVGSMIGIVVLGAVGFGLLYAVYNKSPQQTTPAAVQPSKTGTLKPKTTNPSTGLPDPAKPAQNTQPEVWNDDPPPPSPYLGTSSKP